MPGPQSIFDSFCGGGWQLQLLSLLHAYMIAVYAMCYSVINPCGYRTSGTLSVLVSNGNTPYNVMGVKRHMPVDLPESESISGSEINLTVCAVSNGVLCCNLAESKSVLKMCISKHCHEVTGFLSRIGTYSISCVIQQRSRVKDLSFLVGYDWWKLVILGKIRLVKSVKGIQSLVKEICKITQNKLNCQRLQHDLRTFPIT